jgi:hypothetical protein
MTSRPASRLWWLNPVWCVSVMLGVYASFAGFDFTAVVPRAYVPGWPYAWGAVLLLALLVGIAASVSAPLRLRSGAGLHVPRWLMGLLLGATLLAYAVWFRALLLEPSLLLQVLQGDSLNLRGVIATTPGLTTMTQFGVAYVIAYAALRGGAARRLAAWEHAGALLLLALAVLRAVAWSERLAVIELLLPGLVAWLAFAQVRGAARWQLSCWLPLLGAGLLYAGFTATEAVRSWDFYRDRYASIWVFSYERLLAYYATATNNGAGLLAQSEQWPVYSGRYVVEWLYMLPVVGGALRTRMGDAGRDYEDFLERFARPEFNNPTGLFPIVYDVGAFGSALYFLAAGVLVGRLWLGWRARQPAGLLFYPVAMLFLVELLRFNYFAASRFIPVAMALAVLWIVARSSAAATSAHAPVARASSAASTA